MKNKKLMYVLLPAVIAIWGIVFYKIFSAADGNDQNIAVNTNSGSQNQGSNSYADTFSIVANYRDPFLGNIATVPRNRPQVTASKPLKPQEQKPQPVQAPWPSLGYAGMIRNQKSSVQLAMLQVNGQSYTLKSGEAVEGIHVLKIFKDSIEVSFRGEKRTVKK